MAVKVAINGFGRIGRLVFRAMVEQGLVGKDVQVVAVGDIVPADNLGYLLKYDSTQGRFQGTVSSKKSSADKAEDDVLVVNGADIKVVSAKEPSQLPWKDMGVDLVIEATGLFTDVEKAKGHLAAGAKKVIISAPAKGDCLTMVMGVNQDKYDPAQHHIVSNASCTTNCLAPVCLCPPQGRIRYRGRAHDHRPLLHGDAENRGWSRARRTGRAAAPRRINLIPSTTGAAKAVGLVSARSQRQADRHGLPGSDARRFRWWISPFAPSRRPATRRSPPR